MLSHVLEHLAWVLLYRYAPARAQLGLKTLSRSLPAAVFSDMDKISRLMTPTDHADTALNIRRLSVKEFNWMDERVLDRDKIMPLMQKMTKIQER